MSASKSAGAWNRQLSAVNSYSKFSLVQGFTVAWPIPIETLRAYVGWSLKTKNLAPSTVKQYLSDLKNFHLIRGLPTKHFDDFFLASMLRGAENLSLYANLTKQARLVMSFPLLKILGQKIATSNWSDVSKRVFWGACCMAFFGSFRMGELLSHDEHQYSAETLTWNCVTFTSKNSAVIQVRFPKNTKRGQAQFVDIFEIKDSSVCPFSCLKSLHDSNPSAVAKNLPVFSFSSTKFLSTRVFTKTLRSLLVLHIGQRPMSCQDIPSELAFRRPLPTILVCYQMMMCASGVDGRLPVIMPTLD
jgi:hypothetical protein